MPQVAVLLKDAAIKHYIDAILLKMDEGYEDTAEMFASRIFATRPTFSASKGYRIYQEDAVILSHGVIDILLFDAQHKSLNGETTAVFTLDGMLGCICIYRMREEILSLVSVLLHKLGHLLNIIETRTMGQVPVSFPMYLRRLGTQPAILTIPQFQDVFVDTFMLVVMSQYLEPIPELSDQAFKPATNI